MNFQNYINLTEREDIGSGKIAVFSFGRFQPPTKGHMKLIQKVNETANKVKGDPFICVSQTTDGGISGPKNKGKNPLDWKTKIEFIKKMMPSVNIIDDISLKTPFQVSEWLSSQGYSECIFVVGNDRVEEFKNRWLPYANKDFQKAEVVSAGQRDPDSDKVMGMSGTKARNAAMNNDLAAFTVATGWTGPIAQELMNAVRQRLPEDK